MEHLVVTGFVYDKRARGKQRETFLTYIGKCTNTNGTVTISKGQSCLV